MKQTKTQTPEIASASLNKKSNRKKPVTSKAKKGQTETFKINKTISPLNKKKPKTRLERRQKNSYHF